MRQYNQKTTGATFCIIDYGKRNYGPHGNHSVNLVYTDGKNFIRSNGWFDSKGEAMECMEQRAKMFGVELVGKMERVA